MLLASSSAAIARKDVVPASLISAMIGRKSAPRRVS
jgi:hypothetical protein